MSFLLVGASQMPRMCAATIPFFAKKNFHRLSFFFCRRGGGGVEDGLEMKDIGSGTFESRVSLEESSQKIRLGSSS